MAKVNFDQVNTELITEFGQLNALLTKIHS